MEEYLEELRGLGWNRLAEQVRVQGRVGLAAADWLENPGPRPSSQTAQPGLGLWPRLEEQRFIAALRWGRLRADSETIGRKLAELRARMAPRSLYLLFALLAALLGAGVIAPLVFLSAEGGPSKWILLGLFAPLAVGFVAFYGFELRRLRRADRLIEEAF